MKTMNDDVGTMNARFIRVHRSSFIVHRFPRGFSFTEVLFAVAVLGIGFIMVAAIFPPAIQQTQFAVEQTYGTTVTRNGMNLLQASPMFRNDVVTSAGPPPVFAPFVPVTLLANVVGGTLPPGAIVMSFRDPRMTLISPYTGGTIGTIATNLWNSIRGSLIDASDSRFAIVPMYSRDYGSNFIHVICVAVRTRNTDQLKVDVDAPPLKSPVSPPIQPIVLDPVPVAVVKLAYKEPAQPNQITIANVQSADSPPLYSGWKSVNALNAAVEGAYVIVSDDGRKDDTNTGFVNEQGGANGTIYRLGRQINADTWEIAPDMDMRSSNDELGSGTINNGKMPIAFIVGAGFKYSNGSPTTTLGGANQAVQVYDSLIPLK